MMVQNHLINSIQIQTDANRLVSQPDEFLREM